MEKKSWSNKKLETSHRVGVQEDRIIVGLNNRVTALDSAEARFYALFEGSGMAILVADAASGEIVDCNGKAEELIGRPKNEIVGMHQTQLHPMEMVAERREAFQYNARQDRTVNFETVVQHRDGRVIPIMINASKLKIEGRDLMVGFFFDISELKLAKAELVRISRAHKAISRCNEAMIHAKDEFILLKDICDIFVEVGGYRMAWIGYARDDGDKSVEPVARTGVDDGYVDKAMVSWADSEQGWGPTGTAIRTRMYCVVNDVLTDANFIPWRSEAVRMGYASVIGLPLIADDQAFGVLTIYSEKRDVFNADEIALLQELADNLAYGITALRSRIGREQAERKLRESEQKFRVLAETTKAGISLYRGDKSIYANPAMEKMCGYTNAELLSTAIWDHVHPDYREFVKNRAMDRQRGLSVPEVYEFPVITKGGETRWLEVTAGLIIYQEEPTRIATYFDITERKRAEEAMRKSEARYRTLIDNSPVGIFTCDLEGNITSINPQILEIMGSKSPEFTLSVNMLNFEPMIKHGIADILRDCITTGENRVAETNYTSYWGKSLYMLLHFTPLRDDTGQIYGVLGVMEDITDRKLAEEALRMSEEKFRGLAETMKIGIIIYQGAKSIYVNPAMEKLTGYTNAELLSMDIWDYVRHDYRELVKNRSIDRQCGLSVPPNYEIAIITKDGETRWIEVSAGLILYQGKLTGIGTFFDITERKRAEKALVREKHILTKSQKIAHLGNWAWDVEAGKFMGSDVNDRIHGYEPGDVKPTREWVLSRVHPDDRAVVAEFMEVSARDGKRGSIDYRVTPPDGSVRYIKAIVDKTVLDNAGKVTRLYGITQDITEWKRAEEELAVAKAQAELYLDLMGHDINNMNQSAQGFLELALKALEMDGKIRRDDKVLIEKPLQAIQSSSRLISNVRKLQRLADEGVKMRPIDLNELLEDLKSQDFHTGNRDATINFHKVPHCIVEGSDLLRDVFFNLISNAVKHSEPDKPVTVDIRVDRVNEDGRAYCRCTVDDDGPGVPDDLKPRLFQRFQRGKTKAYGKGLGLYLVKSLVDSYGGRVWVEDRMPGDHSKGARFVVMLPAVEK